MIRKEKEMIYDKLERIGLYAASIPYLGELAEELKAIDLNTIKAGTYYTKKSSIRYMVQEYMTVEKKQPEVHAEYMDVQILLEGNERFTAFRAIDTLPDSFSKADDIGFFDIEDGIDFHLRRKTFIIVYPYEAHIPGLSLEKPEDVRKIVAKIPFHG